MKKILLTTFLSTLMFGSIFAQFNYTTNTNIGQKWYNINTGDKDTLFILFNTSLATSKWWPCKATANLGKDSVSIIKCQTQKGLQAIVYTDATTTTSVQSTNFKCASYTANGNPVHVASLDSLLKVMGKSSASTTLPSATLGDSLTMPAHCLFNNGSTTDQVYGVYPGKYKHLEYGFYISLYGKVLTDDIIFDLGTLSPGTTGKTASYELTVYANTSTISTFSAIGQTNNDTYLVKRISDFYVTGNSAQTINLSSITGKSVDFFTNKYIYIFFKTLGTKNATDVLDGLPNASTGSTHQPVVYDPILYFDNFRVIYSTPVWIVPTGISSTTSTYLDHNNGTVIAGTSTDYLGGNSVSVYPNITNQIKFYLTDNKRASALTITEGNDGGTTNAKYSFAATGAIKAKSGSLGYVTDVPYTFTPTDGTSKFLLSVPAPSSGLATDTLEISISVSGLAANALSSERLEISNGVRFFYDITAKADNTTGNNTINLNKAIISVSDETIYISNVTENVTVFNISGQKIKSVSANEAAQGIKVNSGLYIVKAGSDVQKVLIK